MARASQQTTTPAHQPTPVLENGNPLPALLDAMQQAIDAVAAHAAQCGVQDWQRIRKAWRSINDLLATVERRERKAG